MLAGIHYLLNDRENETFIQTTGVEEIHPHPDRDIALVKLNTPVRLSDRVSPICLLNEEGKLHIQCRRLNLDDPMSDSQQSFCSLLSGIYFYILAYKSILGALD